MALASILSSDPSVTIVLLEAGEPNAGDPTIVKSTHDLYPNYGNPKVGVPTSNFVLITIFSQYDWSFSSVPQKHSNGRQLQWPRGKGLGE